MENVNLIRKIAWSFHKTTGLDYEDLFQEAYLAYVDALKHYNPAKSAITTYMWHCITSRLTNYIKQEDKHRKHLLPLEYADTKSTSINSFFESLTEDAAALAESALKINVNVVPLTHKNADKVIKKELINKGWNMGRIMRAITDIKSRLAYV